MGLLTRLKWLMIPVSVKVIIKFQNPIGIRCCQKYCFPIGSLNILNWSTANCKLKGIIPRPRFVSIFYFNEINRFHYQSSNEAVQPMRVRLVLQCYYQCSVFGLRFGVARGFGSLQFTYMAIAQKPSKIRPIQPM